MYYAAYYAADTSFVSPKNTVPHITLKSALRWLNSLLGDDNVLSWSIEWDEAPIGTTNWHKIRKIVGTGRDALRQYSTHVDICIYDT